MPETEEKQITENLLQKETTPLEKKEEIQGNTEKKEDVEKKEEISTEKPHPPEGGKRWNEVYRKAKENERKVKQLEEDMILLREHNKKLAEMKSAELELTKEVQVRTIKDQIKDLRIKMKKAENELDWDNYVEYESQIEELKSKTEKKSEPFIKQPENTKISEEKKETEKAVKKFTKETSWFDEDSDDYDETMSDAAIMLDQRLMQSWDGTIEERFGEVKKQIEERFNYKKNTKNMPLPNLSGVGNIPSGKNAKIELTPEQKRVAFMLFPDDKEGEKKYSEQLKIIRGG